MSRGPKRVPKISNMGMSMGESLGKTIIGGRCDGSCIRNELTCDVGYCGYCGGSTSSGMLMMCHTCASEREVCPVCGKALTEEVKKERKRRKEEEEKLRIENSCDGSCEKKSQWTGSCWGKKAKSKEYYYCFPCAEKKKICPACGKKNLK